MVEDIISSKSRRKSNSTTNEYRKWYL